MGVLTKEKNHQVSALTVVNYSLTTVLNSDYIIKFIMKSVMDCSKDSKFYEFKRKVKELMLADGASEKFIDENLSDIAIEDAMINDFTAESLAWALLQ